MASTRRRIQAPHHKSTVRFFLCWPVLILSFIWQPFACEGTAYGVGGDGVWSSRADTNYYQAWANGIQFLVGDTILFTYDNTNFDVRSLPTAYALQTCDFSGSTILGNTGSTVVTLRLATTYYFSSNGAGYGIYCILGAQFQAVVTNATDVPPPAPPIVLSPPPPQILATPSPSGSVLSPPPPKIHAAPSTPVGLDPFLFIPPPPAASKSFNVPAVAGSVSGVLGVTSIGGIVYCFRAFLGLGGKQGQQQSHHHQSHHHSHGAESPFYGGQSPSVAALISGFCNGMSQNQGGQAPTISVQL